MELSILIGNIILSMREYQKENNIEKQCVTNVQYLYDLIKLSSTSDIKTKPVFVFSINYEEGTAIFVGGHLVLELDDGTIIDPSYDIFCLKNKSYFDNFSDFINSFDDKNILKTRIDIKKLVKDHLDFKKLSNQINNGNFIITEKEHYKKQGNYIEKLYAKHISLG